MLPIPTAGAADDSGFAGGLTGPHQSRNDRNRRATVLVESKEGQRYSDGKRYAKYYVPLNCLTATEADQVS